jgi:hypothetical protein
MWTEQLRVVTQHPYISKWSSWPFMIRPIWYSFDKEGGNFYRCVIMLGNPLVMWGGLMALASCIWAWFARRSREAFLILNFYCAFYLGWAFIPRKITFYYYYYPAGMTLSMAIAFFFHYWESGKCLFLGKFHILRWTFLAVCIGIFIFFYQFWLLSVSHSTPFIGGCGSSHGYKKDTIRLSIIDDGYCLVEMDMVGGCFYFWIYRSNTISDPHKVSGVGDQYFVIKGGGSTK